MGGPWTELYGSKALNSEFDCKGVRLDAVYPQTMALTDTWILSEHADEAEKYESNT